ncbi:STM3941 family protein [Virgibacillus halophilus]
MIVLTVFSIIFMLLGVLFIIGATTDESSASMAILLLIGVLCIVFFGFGATYFIYVLIKRKPAMIVTREGIIDHSSFIEAGLVKWEEIADLQIYQYGGQVFLGIFTHDPNLIINRTKGIKKALNAVNKKLIDAQVNIPVKNLNCDIDELMHTIGTRWEQSSQM